MYKNVVKYYQENKERRQKKLNISKEEKEKQRQYGCERYKKSLRKRITKASEYRKLSLWNEKKCLIIILRKHFN